MDVSAVLSHLPVASSAGASPSVQAGYGLSWTDLGQFEQALHGAQARLETQPAPAAPGAALRAMAQPLDFVNQEAASLAAQAQGAQAAGAGLTPGDMVNLSVRCQEFMFHCQLTSNVANRASDGVQQLFRQQS